MRFLQFAHVTPNRFCGQKLLYHNSIVHISDRVTIRKPFPIQPDPRHKPPQYPPGIQYNRCFDPTDNGMQPYSLKKKLVIASLLGFASGMPLFVLYQTIPAWLRDSGVDLKSIALFQLIGLPYTFKFLWAPLLDRYRLPFLGLRRGWIVLVQALLLVSIAVIGLFDPHTDLETIVVLTLVMTTFSATADIVIDAYRRELLRDDELGSGNAWFVNAYRLSSLVPGSLALILADHLPWRTVFPITAAFMLVGVATALGIREAADDRPRTTTLTQAVIEPFGDFLRRFKATGVLLIVLFLLFYKLGDSMATALATPFYLDMGYDKTTIGSVAKFAALWASIFGAFVAGVIMRKITLIQSLWTFGLFQMVTILGFAWLSSLPQPDAVDLFVVVSLEYLGVGMGTVAMLAFMAKITSLRFAASQFALLTAITAVPRTFVNASTGWLVEQMGYTLFFILCTVLAIPGMWLIGAVRPHLEQADTPSTSPPLKH